MSEAPKAVLVTGGSSGIGRAAAVAFGRPGWRVALGARRPGPLNEAAADVTAAGGVAFAHKLDMPANVRIDTIEIQPVAPRSEQQ